MDTFDYRIVANPEIFQVNRLPAHSDHRVYADDTALAAGRESFRFSLNGIWKFAYAKNYHLAQKDFFRADYDCRDWDTIHVPAHIQTEGYDVPQYANTQYPWEGKDQVRPGGVPQYFNPTASYVKYFTVPEVMRGVPLYISFQGVESGFALWLNGSYVGYSEDSFTPSEFELTPYLKEGENKLAVMVFKWTAGSWCEDQDFFRFSGIFRDVFLFTVPKVHIWDMLVRPLVSADLAKADLKLAFRPSGTGLYKLRLTHGGETLISGSGELDGPTEISIPVEGFPLWSAEDPQLCDLTIEVTDEAGALQEIICEPVGFRRFELKDCLMLLNGKRIVFKGVDRHEFCSFGGRVLPDELIEQDIVTMKRNNINAIRTSHYPNKSVLYRLCDRYGLYLIDETNLETHGVWDAVISGQEDPSFAVPGDRPEYTELVLDRARSMYERDKNHASILIWSLGNEAYDGSNFLKMHDFFRSQDPTRLVHYEGVTHDAFRQGKACDATDMVTTMYTPCAEIRRYLKDHREKPFILCEYSHAMGNSCGAISKYTEFAYEEPLFQGGFIWDYIDQSMDLTDRYGEKYQGYGGDFGDRPCDYSFSGNGIAYGDDRSPSPKMQEVKYVYQNIHMVFEDGAFLVENRNLFVNTDRFDAVFLLEKEGKPVQTALTSISVAPGESRQVRAPFPLPEDGSEYVLTLSFRLKEDALFASRGHEVAWGQGVIGTWKPEKAPASKLTLIHGWANLGVRGNDFEAIFSRIHGGLVSYRYGGQELFKTIPKPNFWRGMTENDTANQLPFRAGQWKVASMYPSIKYQDAMRMSDYAVEEGETDIKITYTYHLATKPASECSLRYTVTGDGTVGVELILPPSKEIGELPELSVLFGMDASYDRLSWYGLGPEETYPDRKNAKLSVYANEVKDNFARYLVPGECGAKQDVRWAKVTNNRGRGMLFTCEGLAFSALPWNPHELDSATHPTELPRPHYTFVRVGKQMGIAGDDTWGAKTHPEFMLDNSKELSIRFSFRGI